MRAQYRWAYATSTLQEIGQNQHEKGGWAYNTSWAYNTYSTVLSIHIAIVTHFLPRPLQYASWDLAFHMIPFAKVDIEFAKEQLVLFLREWYMAPNGQIPAYEFNFSDVNPPVHAWAVFRVFKMTGARGKRDIAFLARCFQKLILNFTWSASQASPSHLHTLTPPHPHTLTLTPSHLHTLTPPLPHNLTQNSTVTQHSTFTFSLKHQTLPQHPPSTQHGTLHPHSTPHPPQQLHTPAQHCTLP